MANCVNYNCTSLPAHVASDCGETLLGGIASVIILGCDHQITDPSDAVQVQAELDAGRATLVKGIRVGVDAPSPVTVDALVSCQPDKTINYERTGTYIDGNVEDNIDFYNELLDGRSNGGLLLHLCSGDKVFWIDAAVSFQGGVNIPDQDDAEIKFEATFSWKDLQGPVLYESPVGIF